MSKETHDLFLVNDENSKSEGRSSNEDDILEQMLEGIEEDYDSSISTVQKVYIESEIIENRSMDLMLSNLETSIDELQKLSSEIRYYSSEIYNQFHIE